MRIDNFSIFHNLFIFSNSLFEHHRLIQSKSHSPAVVAKKMVQAHAAQLDANLEYRTAVLAAIGNLAEYALQRVAIVVSNGFDN